MRLTQLFIIAILIFACNKSDTATKTTSLRIIVKDSSGNPLPGANVSLFGNIVDLYFGSNQIGGTVITDQNGSAFFDSLQPAIYCFYAGKGCLNNQPPDNAYFQNPNYIIKSLDTTGPLIASTENQYSTPLVPMGSLKYFNPNTDTLSFTWTVAGNTVVPNLSFAIQLNPGDSIYFKYEPAGLYITQTKKFNSPNIVARYDTLHCGDNLAIRLP